jgi:hypothetical protein
VALNPRVLVLLLFNEWRAAARLASAAERRISEAYMLYFNGRGEAPSREQVAEAKHRRAVADDLFCTAIQDWNRSRNRNGPLEE